MIYNRTRKQSKELHQCHRRKYELWRRFDYLLKNNLTEGKAFKYVMFALLLWIRKGRDLEREINAGV